MSKGYFLNFNDSEEELFNWIKKTYNADGLLKGFINAKMTEEYSKDKIIKQKLREYIKSNNLNIDAYKDLFEDL